MLNVQHTLVIDDVTLYRDDADAAIVYALPTSLALAGTPEHYDFSLLFYQADDEERGARLVARFTPGYPQLTAGVGLQRADLPIAASSINLWAPGLSVSSHSAVIDPSGRVELSLARADASMLLQSLRKGTGDVRVQLRAAYDVCRDPITALLRISLREAADALRHVSVLTGASLRAALSERAVELLHVDAALSERELAETAAIAAPYVAARICHADPTAIFADTRLQLRAPEDVPDAQLNLALAEHRSWQEVSSLEWSLCGFYRSVAAANELPKYFPEVLSLPPVGNVQLLVENLLPVDGRLIDRVLVRVRYKRLGSLEESVWSGEYTPGSAPVLACTIPQIAFTAFSYRYLVSVHMPATGSIYPVEQTWQEGHAPILRLEPELVPFVFAFASAQSGVFASLARVDLEIGPCGESTAPGARVTLTAATPYCWLSLAAAEYRERRVRWRSTVYRAADGGYGISSEWREEPKLALTVTLADVYPRTPVRVQVTASYADLPHVQGVTLELASGGSAAEPLCAASTSRTLASDQETQLTLWPNNLFDLGYSHRYAIDTSGREREWTAWRYSTEPRLVMSVADDFYTTRTIELSVRAPWSKLKGPDALQHAAELIFAELHLCSLGSDPADEATYTFDSTSAQFEWTIRSRQRDRRVRYDLDVLTLDGRMLKFGPFELTGDALTLELFVAKSSDTAPAEFGVRNV
jgi:hypothetical protein